MSTIMDAMLGKAWAITPDALQTLLAIVERHEAGLPANSYLSRKQKSRQALEARTGQPLEGARNATYRETPNGKVAIVPITGPIFPRSNLMTNHSGATSASTVAQDFTLAVEDPTVQGILLDIDSPGGNVAMISELSDLVYQARSVKPIGAYASNMMCSAAYWIGSAADIVTAAPTAILGSIGVVATYLDTKEADKRDGVKKIEIVSSNAPHKREDPSSKSGRAAIQAEVDATEEVFVEAVARNRGVRTKTVLQNFGRGGVFVGKAAVSAGLADEIGTFEEMVALFSQLQPHGQ